jgi:uracil phosphoribosyltransferase
MTAGVHVLSHPLVAHKLTLMRDKRTSTRAFRMLLEEVSVYLAYEATRDLEVALVPIETPLAAIEAPTIAGKKLVLVSVLRAGNGILAGFLHVIPSARVGHIGIRRDPVTLEATEYAVHLPEDLAERDAIVLDPMLATGNSAIAAIGRVRARGGRRVKLVSLLAAPEGISAVQSAFPDVPIYTTAIDDHLNEHAYIVPGLGDAGDRLFGTK